MPKENINFLFPHEGPSWSISANRETVTINDKVMPSLSAYQLSKDIVELFEKEKRAFDYYGREVIIP